MRDCPSRTPTDDGIAHARRVTQWLTSWVGHDRTIAQASLRALTEGKRKYFGPNGFAVDEGMDTVVDQLLDPSPEIMLTGGRLAIRMLLAYTINAARAMNQQTALGSIEPGKQADLTLVDRDVMTVPAEALRDTKVLGTMFSGRWVDGGAS